MKTIGEWKIRILEYFVARSRYTKYRVSGKEEIFRGFGSNVDANADIAFMELITEGLIIKIKSSVKQFYTIDFVDKMKEIKDIIQGDSIEEKAQLIQPDETEFEGLTLMFSIASQRKYPNQGIYYYCINKDDESHWIILVKTRIAGKAARINLGSLKDLDSRISKILKATITVAKESEDGNLFRKQVEDREQKACGNNRQPSKAAFDIFVKLGFLTIVGQKRRQTTLYKLNEENIPSQFLNVDSAVIKQEVKK